MTTLRDLKPLQRQALPLMLAAPNFALERTKGGYAAPNDPQRTAFTIRTVNAMQADNLVDFDQPMFPTRITLTAHGKRIAEQLVEAQRNAAAKAKAGAA